MGCLKLAEITWFKVLTDIFADDKIKIIQSMPEGDALLVMWFKVLSQAGKTNDGGYIYLKKTIPYTPAMLATLFGKHQQLVELALRTFSEFGMIDMDDRGYIFVTHWEKHQNIEGMDKVREQTRQRNIRYREKKRIELQGDDVNRDVTVTVCDAIEVEEELEKELKDSTTTAIAISNPFRLFESEGFGTLSSILGQKIGYMIDEYSERWVCEAMKEAAYYGKRSLPYVKGILDRYKTCGVDEPWKGEKKDAKHGGHTQGIRLGENQTQSSRHEGESKVYPGRWDDTPIQMPKLSG